MSSLASRAWLVVVLLWPVALLNYLDRQMLATLKTSVCDDILRVPGDEPPPSPGAPEVKSKVDTQFGWIMATFMYVYAILSPIGGFIGDRFDRRLTLIFSLLVWSAVTFATGLATNFTEMIVLRALMGVSEAFYIPTALAMISEFHPGPTRTRAVGLHQTGIYAGTALGGLGAVIAAQTGSWRNAFYIFGIIGIAYALVLFVALPGPPRSEDRAGHRESKAGVLETLKVLWGQWAFWLLVAYFTLPAVSGWLMKNWLPAHIKKDFELTEAAAGMWASMTPVVGQVFGAVFGGWLADSWSLRTPRGRILASACGTGLVACGLVVLAFSSSLPMAVVGMVTFGIGWGMFDSNNMPILCQLVAPKFRATGYGFMNLVSIGTGASSTVLQGVLNDAGTPFQYAFLGSAAIAVLGAMLILLVKPTRVDAGTS